MKYDFDTVVDRRNTGSLKWDVRENELPMWVADMDFKTAPAITEAIIERAQHGIYGYSIVPDEWGAVLQGMVEKQTWLGYRHRLACVYNRCYSCYIECGKKAHNT